MNRPQSFYVDDWQVCPDANELRRDGEIQKLESRVMDLLVYLHQNKGEVVGRDEIINEVWGKEALSDHSISVAIAALRRALGDSAAEPRYIETVRKKGYRLIAVCDVVHAATNPLPQFTTMRRVGAAALAATMAAMAYIVFAPTAATVSNATPVLSVPAPEIATGDQSETRLAELYQLALELEGVRSDATTRTAHSLALEALEIDPEYGPAHSLLAFLYAESSPEYWGMEGERYERATNELVLARKYGSNEAHNLVTEAYLRRARDGRPDFAAHLLDRAIGLAPDDPWVLRMSVLTGVIMGEFDQALSNNISAVEHSLDPGSILAERTFPLYFLGRYDETVEIYDATRELGLLPVYYGPQAAILGGDHAKGFRLWIDLLREHDVKIDDETAPMERIANGDIAAAYAWLQPQLPDDLSRKNVPLIRASWHMTAGDSDAAMETLLGAAQDIYGGSGAKPTPTMLWSVIQYDPIYKELRHDPRMAEVLDLVGIRDIVQDYKTRSKGGPSAVAATASK